MNLTQKKHSGKVALVTGESRGIGAAIAKRLAADGALVAITYSSGQQKADEVVRSIESGGGRALAIRADNTDANAVKNAVAETVRTLGRLDVLMGDAFLFKPNEPHQLINDGTRNLVVYVVADNPIGESVCYPDSKNSGVRSPERRVFRGEALDYYDEEE